MTLKNIAPVLLLAFVCSFLFVPAAPAEAASISVAKRLIKKLAPVNNPLIYDVSTRDMRKQGSRALWVYFLPLNSQPDKYSNSQVPDGFSFNSKPKLGFGLIINKENQVIVDYYLDRNVVFSTGGALSDFAIWKPLRNGQPIDERSDPYLDSYCEAISTDLSGSLGLMLACTWPGMQLRQIANQLSYRYPCCGAIRHVYLSVFTSNSTSASIDIISPSGTQSIKKFVKRSRPADPNMRNPGVQEWVAKISLRKNSLFDSNDVDFRVNACNNFGCFIPGPGADKRSIWHWNHEKLTFSAK